MTNKLYLMAPRKEGLLEGNPSSLLYLGEWARRAGINAEIVHTPQEISTEKEAYLGISATTPTYQKSLEAIRVVKARNQKIKTIFGGYHTKGQGKVIAENHPEIDFIVEGEGEKSLIEILQGRGLRVNYGTPLTSGELDSISINDLIKLNPSYFASMRQFGRMNYSSTRGCPFACSFCASNGRFTKKSVGKIAEDLETLANAGFRDISIQDNYFGQNPQRIREICEEIFSKDIKIDWDCQTRVESMQDFSLLQLMKASSCSAVYLGTENFHPEVLKRMGKTISPDNYLRLTKNSIYLMLNAGIKPYLNLQVGLPFETENIRKQNIKNLSEIGRLAIEHNEEIQIYTHLNVVYPGTLDFESLKEDGIPEDIFEAFTLWEEKANGRVKFFLDSNGFIHGTGGIPRGILIFDKLKEKKFELDEGKMNEINEYVNRIRIIPGIRVYNPQTITRSPPKNQK